MFSHPEPLMHNMKTQQSDYEVYVSIVIKLSC